MSNQGTSMNLEKIKSLQHDLNEKLLKRLNKSIVFVDSQFMEWFTLTIGIDVLIKQAGVHNIKEFSPFENGEEFVKAVIFISQPLRGVVLETLKEIIISSKFQYLTILTNLEPILYDESSDYFDKLSDQCLMWMSNPVRICLT